MQSHHKSYLRHVLRLNLLNPHFVFPEFFFFFDLSWPQCMCDLLFITCSHKFQCGVNGQVFAVCAGLPLLCCSCSWATHNQYLFFTVVVWDLHPAYIISCVAAASRGSYDHRAACWPGTSLTIIRLTKRKPLLCQNANTVMSRSKWNLKHGPNDNTGLWRCWVVCFPSN